MNDPSISVNDPREFYYNGMSVCLCVCMCLFVCLFLFVCVCVYAYMCVCVRRDKYNGQSPDKIRT